jgi:hypothetical protein
MARADGVIPLAVKGMGCQVDSRDLVVGDATPGAIPAAIEPTRDRESLRGCGVGNEPHDRFIVAQWLAAPVGGDKREQAVLDLVPLARPGRKVTHAHRESGRVGERLQVDLPLAEPVAVAAAPVRRDKQRARRGIEMPPFRPPRIDATANAPVSWSVPTFTNLVLCARS